MKKSVVISLVLIVAFTLASSAGFAQSNGQTVEIHALAVSEVTISPEDVLILHYGWGACTRGLVRAYTTAANNQVTMGGAVILSGAETDQYFGPIYSGAPNDGCIAGKGTLWFSQWRYPMEFLSEGTYVITTVLRLDHPVTDGYDFDGNGRPDHFRGELGTGTVTVHVVEP